ncbi:MAG: hypothetical protein ACLTK0_03865 [Anaerovoracaceae bacterium]
MRIFRQKFSQLVYDGLWYTPLREAISAFVDLTQQLITGTVRMKLYKGSQWSPEESSLFAL